MQLLNHFMIMFGFGICDSLADVFIGGLSKLGECTGNASACYFFFCVGDDLCLS